MENHHAINGTTHYFDWAIFSSSQTVSHNQMVYPSISHCNPIMIPSLSHHYPIVIPIKPEAKLIISGPRIQLHPAHRRGAHHRLGSDRGSETTAATCPGVETSIFYCWCSTINMNMEGETSMSYCWFSCSPVLMFHYELLKHLWTLHFGLFAFMETDSILYSSICVSLSLSLSLSLYI